LKRLEKFKALPRRADHKNRLRRRPGIDSGGAVRQAHSSSSKSLTVLLRLS